MIDFCNYFIFCVYGKAKGNCDSFLLNYVGMNDDIYLGRKHDIITFGCLLPLCLCGFFLFVLNFRKINKILVCDRYTSHTSRRNRFHSINHSKSIDILSQFNKKTDKQIKL